MDYLQYFNTTPKAASTSLSFKPYYKWITFNTFFQIQLFYHFQVLNLIINGLPSILNLL